MLGHVAQSIGGALPGGLSISPFVGQFFTTTFGDTTFVVPDGALFMFGEAVGAGGQVFTSSSSSLASSGGAGEDAIIEVVPGETLTASINASFTDIKRGSTVLLRARAGAGAQNVGATYPFAATAGKYPGGGAQSATSPGNGGGRLGGLGLISNDASRRPGIGGGAARNGSGYLNGVSGAVCATFFRSQDAALAFANSLYGGNWQP